MTKSPRKSRTHQKEHRRKTGRYIRTEPAPTTKHPNYAEQDMESGSNRTYADLTGSGLGDQGITPGKQNKTSGMSVSPYQDSYKQITEESSQQPYMLQGWEPCTS